MANRDTAGRFAGSDDRKPQFDLLASLKKLFALAERNGDFSGASTVARTIASLGEAAVEQAAPAENLVSYCTIEEKTELYALVQQHRLLMNRVKERLGRPQDRPGILDTPPVPSTWCPRCHEYQLFWSATEEEQATFLIKHFGEDAMREAVLKFGAGR